MPPALGYLTINGLAAANIVLVPFGASLLEFESTGRFFDMLSSIENSENIAARALGRDTLHFEWDVIRPVMSHYDADQQAEMAALIQFHLGPSLSPHRQDFTALIGQAEEQVHCIYEPITATSIARPMHTVARPSVGPIPLSKRCFWAPGDATSWVKNNRFACENERRNDVMAQRKRLTPLGLSEAETD